MTAPTIRNPLTAFAAPPPPGGGAGGDPGLFGPHSAAWRVGRERVLLFGGAAALLLQVGHPLVAAGVTEHSDFTSDPVRRLTATLEATLTITFGDAAQARAAAERVGRRHRPVRGTVAGRAYDARDPQLAAWVHATLVWSALRTYHDFVAPLPDALADRYVDEMRRFGALFGADGDALPANRPQLDAYVTRMVATGEVAPDENGRVIASSIFASARETQGPGADALARVLAAAMLPDPLRRAYGLPWGPAQQRTYALLRRGVRATLPALPRTPRFWPHYEVARRRLVGGP